MNVKITQPNALLPKRSDAFAAGYDLYSCETKTISPWSRSLINTGIAMEIPPTYYGRIAPRSSLALKNIDIGAGVIDSNYRGDVKVLLINSSDKAFEVTEQSRIAQIIFERHYVFDMNKVNSLNETCRGEKGFGSTGR
jgi:dUTP pyrophosphatase